VESAKVSIPAFRALVNDACLVDFSSERVMAVAA
jgi:hypothetical protein